MKKLTNKEIVNKRERVLQEFKRKSLNVYNDNITNISPIDIKLLVKLYAQEFWGDEKIFKTVLDNVTCSVSDRMTSAAGKAIYKVRGRNIAFEIRISRYLILNSNKISGNKKVCGIVAKSNIEAMALVIEHELIHVFEYMAYGESNCRAKRFKELSYFMFGHTEAYHQLPGKRQVAKKVFDVKIGDKVSFTYKDKKHVGLISNITKRATVMIKDNAGRYVDKRGNRYSKVYVPLDRLQKV